jgi:hypothetical protein
MQAMMLSRRPKIAQKPRKMRRKSPTRLHCRRRTTTPVVQYTLPHRSTFSQLTSQLHTRNTLRTHTVSRGAALTTEPFFCFTMYTHPYSVIVHVVHVQFLQIITRNMTSELESPRVYISRGSILSSTPTFFGLLTWRKNFRRVRWLWYWTSVSQDATDKIRQYRSDYNNRPSNDISFKSDIGSTSGCLHSEFVFLLFLQDHRETDRFFAASGVLSYYPFNLYILRL